jgi:predicted phosphoadenosine phosphosulfate sulfurtransferase
MSGWVRESFSHDWHLEDIWSAQAKQVGYVRTACGELIFSNHVSFERAETAAPHQRCTKCDLEARRRGVR